MGTDAILTSKKKKLYCEIDRRYHVDITGDCDYDEWYKGVSRKRAIEILQQILKRAVGSDEYQVKVGMLERETPCRGNVLKALRFVESLDEDDTIGIADDASADEDYWLIQYQQDKIDKIYDDQEADKDEPFYDPEYVDWREWKG